jgi:asparagine synthase (glutamine-hydrolysing)
LPRGSARHEALMSRIAGIVERHAHPSPLLVQAMGAAQRPQNASAFVSVATAGNAVFAFTGSSRSGLASRGPIMVVCDGVLFNRAQLLATGEDPSVSDADILADHYERRGIEETLSRANGDFGLAIFDTRDDTLWLARDRFGVRPLYYVHRNGWLAFASRISALLSLPEVPRAVDRGFVARFAGSHYRTFDNEPTRSPYEAILQLPAASYARWRGGEILHRRYWALADEPDFSEPEAALAERYRELLLDSVAIRVARAKRPAFTLSGGMDSSSVVACATRESGRKQLAYSTVYEDATYDETAEIRTVLDATVSTWVPVHVGNPDLTTLIPRMVAANDEPVATATWLSHYVLCERAHADGIGALFGGLGGDELNAGEYEYFFFFFADLIHAGETARLTSEVERWVTYHDHPIYRKSFAHMQSMVKRVVDPQVPGKCLPDRTRLDRYASVVRKEYFDLNAFTPVMETPFASYLKNRTYQDIYLETAPCCLRAADRQAGSFGIDLFWPFFDHRLVEFMFRIPGTMKIRDGVTKHLLRRAMVGLVPEPTRTRIKKTGWNAPAHVWFAGSGREMVSDILSSRAFLERGIYAPERVRSILAEHQAIVLEKKPVENHMMFLWQLVNLELWLQAGDPSA